VTRLSFALLQKKKKKNNNNIIRLLQPLMHTYSRKLKTVLLADRAAQAVKSATDIIDVVCL